MGVKNLEADIESPTVGVGLSEKKNINAFLRQQGNEALLREFLSLSQLSNSKAIWSITRQWICIAIAVGFAISTKSWWGYALAIVVISTRQHALGIIMHDATHWRLFSNKGINDVVGNIFCGFPINTSVSRYRYEHLLHHQYNMQEKDPYKRDWDQDPHWHWPKTKGQVFWLFCKDLFSLNMSHLGPTLIRWSPWANHFSTRNLPPAISRTERFSVYGFLTVLLVALTVTHGWLDFFLLWLVPMSTVTVLLVRIRSVTEHLHLPGENEFNRTRHVTGSLLERWTVAPLNINIHIAHHMFPSVPQYNLPRLHELLLLYPAYKNEGRIYDSYFSGGRRAFDEMIR